MKKIATLGLWFYLACFAPPAHGASNPVAGNAVSGTVQAGGLSIHVADLTLLPKGSYVYMLLDAYPYREALRLDSPDPKPLEPVLEALVEGLVLARWPSTTLVKSDVVEFPQRDDYGTPRWDSVKRLGKFEIKVRKHRAHVKRLAEPEVTH